MMDKVYTKKPFGRLSPYIFAVFLGIYLGTSVLLLPPLWALGIPVGILATIITLKHPSIGILSVLFFLCTVIPEESIPVIHIGPGRLYITEPIVLAMFGIMTIRWITNKDFKFRSSPINLPLVLFYSWALLSTIRAIIWSDLTISEAIPEVRIVSYYMIFFLITNLLTNEDELELFVQGFFIFATSVAIAMIIQYAIGTTLPFLTGTVETLKTRGEEYGGVTRIFDTVGEATITAGFIIMTVKLFTNKLALKEGMGFIQWSLLTIAMILTFSRTHWLIAALAFGLTFILTRKGDKKNLINWIYFLFFSIPIIVILIFAFPNSQAANLLNASINRFSSIISIDTFTGSSDTSTLRWRDFEYKYAIPQILQHPFFGLGLGAIYRPPMLGIDDAWSNLQRYIHNSQVWIAVKTGLVGYSFLIWFSVAFLWRGFKYWRQVPTPDKRGLFLGTTLSYVGVMIASNIHPMFTVLFWTPIIGMILGLNEAIIHLYIKE